VVRAGYKLNEKKSPRGPRLTLPQGQHPSIAPNFSSSPRPAFKMPSGKGLFLLPCRKCLVCLPRDEWSPTSVPTETSWCKLV
jgi:hypothetical protein